MAPHPKHSHKPRRAAAWALLLATVLVLAAVGIIRVVGQRSDIADTGPGTPGAATSTHTGPARADAAAHEQEVWIPVQLQAALLARTLPHVQSASGPASRNDITIVHSGSAPSAAFALQLVAALERFHLAAEAVPLSALPRERGASEVVYLLPDLRAPLREAAPFDAASGTLIVGSTSQLVEEGPAALGFGVRADQRPEVILNDERLRAGGYAASTELRSLARVTVP